jgi:ribosomal protein L19E
MAVTERGRGRRGTQKPKKPRKVADHAAFGMWADREDMKGVQAWVKKIRALRYDRLERRRPKP